MRTCKCGGKSFLWHSAKHSDMTVTALEGDDGIQKAQHEGYALNIPGLCSGDYTELEICIKCGTIQDWVPLTDSQCAELFK